MTLDQAMITLKDFIERRFAISHDDPDFNEDVHLFQYGYIDSFGAVELTQFVEHTFGIQVNDSDLIVYPMNTVREIAAFVVGRQTEGR